VSAARVPLFGRIVRTLTGGHGVAAEHSYPAGLVAAPHVHAHSYLTVLLDGATTERFDNRAEHLAPPAVHLMLAGQKHGNEYTAATRALHLQADAALHQVDRDLGPGPLRDGRAPLFGTLLYDEFRRDDDLAPLSIEGLLLSLLARAPVARPAGWLAVVTDALHDTYRRRVSLSELSAIAGVHPAHLCRAFHKHTGKTIGGYVRELRIARACRLLSSSGRSLAEIALDCGFSDQSHFAAAFRRTMRMTPGAFRRTRAV
jgi:AraC family transcriptional regulator